MHKYTVIVQSTKELSKLKIKHIYSSDRIPGPSTCENCANDVLGGVGKMSWSIVEFYRPNFTYNWIAVQNSASALLSWALVSRKIAIQQHIFDIIISYDIMTCAQLGKVIFSANTYVKVVWMVAPLFFILHFKDTHNPWDMKDGYSALGNIYPS